MMTTPAHSPEPNLPQEGAAVDKRSRLAWDLVCMAMVLPAVLLPVGFLCFGGDARSWSLTLWQAAAAFSSGPFGLIGLRWEFNFPVTADWGYQGITAVSALAQWGLIWAAGEFIQTHKKPVRFWGLVIIVPIWLLSFGFHFSYWISAHS